MTERPRTRNPRGRGELLRQEILRAGVSLIDKTNDPAALTLRGIARQADISAPSIYPHFNTLPALIDALLAESFAELAEVVHTSMDAATTPAAKLYAAGHAYVRFGWEHKARYRLMFAEDGYAQNAIDTFTLVAETLRSCVDTGASTSTDVRADTWTLWAGLHGVATLDRPARSEQLRLGPLDRPAMLDTIIRRLAQLSE